MAEVVGLLASIATLIEVAGKTGRTISRIRKLHASPPRYVLAAQNEIEHFTAALDLIQDILSNGVAAPPDKATAELVRLRKQAMTALQELDTFLKEEVILVHANGGSTLKLRRKAKVKEIFGEAQSEFLDFQQQLMSIKQNMQLVLQALQFQAHSGASFHLQRISVVHAGITTTVDAGNGDVTAACLEKAVVSSTTTLVASKSPDTSSIRSHSLVRKDDHIVFELQRASNGCRQMCHCQCHIPIRGSTPRWLQGLMGTVFLSLSGVPLLNRRACNYKGCSGHGVTNGSAHFQYMMPTWALPYAIETTATWNTLGGLGGTWTLKIPRFMNNYSLFEKFLWLCHDGTVEDFQKLMATSGMRAFDVFNESLQFNSTLFALATRNSRPDVCKMLIENGADMSYRDACGVSMVEIFWLQQHVDSGLKELAYHPVLAEAHERLNITPGHNLVIENASDDLARHLINFPAAVTLRDDSGFTLLHWAAKCGAVEALEVLVKAGADVNAVCNRGRTPLMWGASGNTESTKIYETLIRVGADVNITDRMGNNALIWQIITTPISSENVRLLLDAGSNIHCANESDMTALEEAAAEASAGSLEACILLLERGALLNRGNADGWTPVSFAIAYNNHDVLDLFIEQGASLNTITNNAGWTTHIHDAALWADIRTMEILSDAHIEGLAMDEDTITKYWELFDMRDKSFLGIRDPVEDEMRAFQELLDSIVPLDPSLVVAQPEPERIVPGAFPTENDCEEEYPGSGSEDDDDFDLRDDANQRISEGQVPGDDGHVPEEKEPELAQNVAGQVPTGNLGMISVR